MPSASRHPAEAATLKSFVAPPKRDRLLTLLATPKRRAQGLDALNHFAHWDPRFAQPILPTANVVAILKKAGAPRDCHIISNSPDLDALDMPLAQAVEACESYLFASVLCCIPGELAFFFDEAAAPRIRVLLQRQDGIGKEPGLRGASRKKSGRLPKVGRQSRPLPDSTG